MDLLASARQAVDVWAPLAHHPAIVGLRRAFVTSDYDPKAPPALCFAYDFHPGKRTRMHLFCGASSWHAHPSEHACALLGQEVEQALVCFCTVHSPPAAPTHR